MTSLGYDDAPFAVRDDLVAAHHRVWDRLGKPGTWLDATTRIHIAAEVRQAPECQLCRRRKESLSPYSLDGRHDSLGTLRENGVEVIHRIATDPARLTHSWYRRMLETGISDAEYVETVSVLAQITALDTFARGIGVPKRPLPQPTSGSP